ncbi:late promoter transcription protein [Synechococcus phage S-B64]|uniref:Late promoter transcription protein n=2 Tax=Shandvirus TaxID=2948904 RepID=A0A1Z1LWC1_9CAUD|nr:late promoter transcriptional regulator [Synechococcus phage S-H35]YP_010095358.1 late promoter transcriptional regulator [Synechococcus phage S-B64]ARW56958.1 late promoter transcription protein [Synechococcus phage S-H35]AWD90156.1 late promoter transcription protein [Synechococcus phage S-B64]QBQ75113.1 transcriptional regulator [Cyanophage S-RIM4]
MPKDNPEEKFMTPSKFSMEIERLVKTSNGLITYIEAVVTFCQENEIEMESVPKLLSKPLKERLRHEAQRMNYMKKSSRGVLPL